MADLRGGGRGLRPTGGRTTVFLAGAVLLLAACGSAMPVAKAKGSAAGADRVTTTSTEQGAAAPAHQDAPTGAGGRGAPGAANGSSPAVAPAQSAASGPGPVQPGTYRYSQSGSFKAGLSSQSVPNQGSVVVDLPAAQGRASWTQVWHSYVDTSQPPSDTAFAIAPSGIAIVSEVIRMSGVTFTCTFSPPLEVVSWPPAVGHQFSGTGACGSFTAQVSGSVTGTQATSVDGTGVTAFVVQTHVTTTGSVSSSSTETDWFDPALGLDLSQDSSQSGTYEGISFSSQITRKLVSGRPG